MNKYLTGVVAILVIAGGWWYFSQSNTSSTSKTSQQNPGWKTYSNAEYGFEFEHPADWHVLSRGQADAKNLLILGLGRPGPDDTAWVNVLAESNMDKAIEQHIGQYVAGTKIEKREKIVVDGVEGQLIYLNVGGNDDRLSRWIFLPHAGKTYVVGITVDIPPYDSEFNKILASYRFK